MDGLTDKLLYGSSIKNSVFQPSDKDERLLFPEKHPSNRFFAINETSVFQNILVLGCAGSGKTNVLNQFVAQVTEWNKQDETGINLIFDTKGDYIEHPGFFRDGDFIIGNDSRFRDKSVIWNIFDDTLKQGNN